MTVSTPQIRVSYSGDNVTTAFPIPYPFYLATDLLVILAGTAIASGFSVSGGNGSTGTLNMASAPTIGKILQIILNVPLTQLTNLVDGTAFPSATINQVNDRAIQAALRLQDQISRSIRAPDGDNTPGMLLPAAASRAGLFLGFDGAGNILATSAGAGTANTQATLGPILNPQTAAEATALVTPTNFSYPPLHAWRYGADPTGVADATTSLTNWIKVINQDGVLAGQSFRAAYLPGGVYRVSSALPPITTSKIRIYGDGSDVSRIQVYGGAASFTVLHIGNTVPTSTIIQNIQVEGLSILRNSGSGSITLMKVIHTQYSHYRDITLYDNTGTVGGVSLEYRGHENNTFENLWLTNVQCLILGNPSGTLGDGCDHTEWRGLEMQCNSNTNALITVIGASTTLSNQVFTGNQVWLGGLYGFLWNDTGAGNSLGVGGDLLFENIRREQTSGASAGETVYIRVGGSSGGGTNDRVSNVTIRNTTSGLVGTLSGGYHFDGVLWATLENCDLSVGGVGITMVARTGTTSTQLTTINCNLDPAATTLTNMEKVFGSNDLILGATNNPSTCVYQYTDVNNQTIRGMRLYEGRKWIGKRAGVVTTAGFIVPGSSTSVGILTIAASAGAGAAEGGVFILQGSATTMISGTANTQATIGAGKLSVTWNGGTTSYLVTNNLGNTRDILVTVDWM